MALHARSSTGTALPGVILRLITSSSALHSSAAPLRSDNREVDDFRNVFIQKKFVTYIHIFKIND